MITGIIQLIKLEIEDSFGRKVLTARDCEELSGEVFLKTGQRIHANTLRRFFAIVKTKNLPSKSTLQILAKYCGYSSIEELRSFRNEEQDGTVKMDPANVLRFVHALFHETQVRGYDDPTFLSQMPILIRFFNHNVALAERLGKIIARTKNGQEFYFEQCINIDRLNSYYGDGLRYYLAEKETKEAILFGHGMLGLRAWLTKDDQQLEKEFKALSTMKLDHSINPFLQGRYYAVCLYHADILGKPTKGIIKKALEVYSGVKKPAQRPYELFPTFSQALAFTGHFEEAIEAIELRNRMHRQDTAIDKSNNEIFDLLKAFCLSRLGRKKEAAAIIKEINPTEFHFLARKYKTILYLLTSMHIKRSADKIHLQLQNLLQTTGFVRLEKYM